MEEMAKAQPCFKPCLVMCPVLSSPILCLQRLPLNIVSPAQQDHPKTCLDCLMRLSELVPHWLKGRKPTM